MKTKITRKLITMTCILAAATVFTLPLQAGRGNGGNGGGGYGGNAGVCPNGYEPGTRAMENCPRPQDGSGSQYGKGNKGAKQGQCDGQGQGQGNGQRRGNGQGIGNPADCPNNPAYDPEG